MGYRLSAISLAASYLLPAVGYLSDYGLLTTGYGLPAMGYQLSAISLTTGYGLPAVGYLSGYLLLATGYRLSLHR